MALFLNGKLVHELKVVIVKRTLKRTILLTSRITNQEAYYQIN